MRRRIHACHMGSVHVIHVISWAGAVGGLGLGGGVQGLDQGIRFRVQGDLEEAGLGVGRGQGLGAGFSLGLVWGLVWGLGFKVWGSGKPPGGGLRC